MDSKFERPQSITEQEPVVVEEELVVEDAVEDVSPPDDDDDESWRDEVVADMFDRPTPPKPPKPAPLAFADFLGQGADRKHARDLEDRARRRRGSGAHVVAENESGAPNETSTPEVVVGPSGG